MLKRIPGTRSIMGAWYILIFETFCPYALVLEVRGFLVKVGESGKCYIKVPGKIPEKKHGCRV